MACTIVIPVYNAFHETLACIRSVLRHTSGPYRLLIIDDCSPHGHLREFLPEAVLRDPHVHLLRSAENRGFVQTCNVGMRWSRPDDVVLLNSDTEVTPGWLRKLAAAAASSPRVGSVTPLTNNGEICSVPRFMRNNELPPGLSLDDFARLVEQVSKRRYVELPTCVGFCVYLKREVLDRVGLFDEERFGKGYGEENDLSCRMQAAGYVDILDDATFVHHKGKMSFGEATAKLQARHIQALEAKHPGYSLRVQKFVAANPLAGVHRAIHDGLLARWEAGVPRRVLHVLHKSPMVPGSPHPPGGVEYHVADLVRAVPGAAHWSLFREDGAMCLRAHVPGAEQTWRFSSARFDPAQLVDRDLFDVVHLHHASALDFPALARALARHGRYYVSLHDYALCCPRTNLVTRGGQLCDTGDCATCCGENAQAVDTLRTTTAAVFEGAQAVIHFSQSTRELYAQRTGQAPRWRLVPHGVALPTDGGAPDRALWQTPTSAMPLRVALLGGINRIKGADLVRDLVASRKLPGGQGVQWHMVGVFDGVLPPHVVQHGRYERADLAAILARVAPHLVLIPSICPETYCFTLDEALSCGVPVMVTPLGAPAERVKQYGCGWVLEELAVPAILAALTAVVDDWDGYRAVAARVRGLRLREVCDMARQYAALYTACCPEGRSVDLPRLLKALDSLTRLQPHVAAWPRRAVGRALNGCVSLLDRIRVRPLAASMARRILPGRMKRVLDNFRLAAVVPAESRPPASKRVA